VMGPVSGTPVTAGAGGAVTWLADPPGVQAAATAEKRSSIVGNASRTATRRVDLPRGSPPMSTAADSRLTLARPSSHGSLLVASGNASV